MKIEITKKQDAIIRNAIGEVSFADNVLAQKKETLAKVVNMLLNEDVDIQTVKVENNVLIINE